MKYGWWKLLTLVFGLFIVLSLFSIIQDYKDKQNLGEHCIVRGSLEHKVRLSTDARLASIIIKSGNELGPYFYYNFCGE